MNELGYRLPLPERRSLDLPPSPREIMFRRAGQHWGLILGGSVVLFFVMIALLAPWLAPYDPFAQDLMARLVPPIWGEGGSWAHPLGTDALGRDYLSRILFGTRISLSVAFGATVIACVFGSLLGIIGGYFGGRTDALVLYIINVKLALPGVLIALSLVFIFGGSVSSLIVILGFLTWDRYAVVTRSVTQQLRERDFVAAAQALGASHAKIIFREVLPNVLNQIIVVASLELAVVIIIEATLSFLGLGVQPPTPSWGLMISEGRAYMFFQPYLIVIPGAAIFALVMAINMAGDGIRDVTAPEGRG